MLCWRAVRVRSFVMGTTTPVLHPTVPPQSTLNLCAQQSMVFWCALRRANYFCLRVPGRRNLPLTPNYLCFRFTHCSVVLVEPSSIFIRRHAKQSLHTGKQYPSDIQRYVAPWCQRASASSMRIGQSIGCPCSRFVSKFRCVPLVLLLLPSGTRHCCSGLRPFWNSTQAGRPGVLST